MPNKEELPDHYWSSDVELVCEALRNNTMITIEVMGGLGNQLFQVFHLISYCLSHKVPFYFEHKALPDRADRPFYWDTLLSSLKPFVKTSHDKALPVYREEGFHFTKIMPYSQINKPFKFFGYFQSYKYFQDKERDILRLIGVEKQREAALVAHGGLCDFDNTISLHFRIGDYKHQPQNHPLASIAYYEMALQHVIDRTGRTDWNVLYFYEAQDADMVTDRINTLRERFGHLTFTPIDTDIADYRQVLLMASCAHNIIANSSFSWWGARFNQRKDKVVTYPRDWFGPALGVKRMDDMFPEWWCGL
jgi:hypothetical protein